MGWQFTPRSLDRDGHRLRLPVVAVVLALLLTSCPGPDVDDDCQCPNLLAAAEAIDWIGNGTVPDELLPSSATGRFGLKVILVFPAADRVALQENIEDRMRSAGFRVTSETPFSVTFEDGDWSTNVATAGTETEPQIAITIKTADDDARAAEILSPISEALGTLP